jgi:heme oxygenase
MIIELSEERIRRQGETMAALRTATRKMQDRLDMSVNLSRLITSRARYRRLLERLFGFFVPMEFKLDEVGVPEALDLETRRKSSALLLDLISLGSTKTCLDELGVCEQLPEISTPEQVLGAVYVLEETLIGGQFICQLLHQRLGIPPEAGGRFFSGYGGQTRCMWRKYCEVLESTVTTTEQRDAVIEAAIETYSCLQTWLEEDACHFDLPTAACCSA